MAISKDDHQRAIEFLKRDLNQVDRAMAKAVVMIIPYGAGLAKYQQTIGQILVDRALPEWPRGTSEPAPTTYQSWVGNIPGFDGWKPHTRRPFADAARERRAAVAGWLRGVCAFHLAQHFSDALDSMFPAVKAFKNRLSRAIEPVVRGKLPVMWISPSGFPVLQDAFQLAENAIDVKVLKNRLRFSLRELRDAISAHGQRTGILPNFIHSLDAAHLVKTVNLAQSRGVTSLSTIHDAYATHACDMGTLGQCIREAFCQVYPSGEDRLERFEHWCTTLAGKAQEEGYDQAGGLRSEAERALLGLARKWAPVGEESERQAVAAEKPASPRPAEDWIHRVQESEYFFT